MSAAVELDVSAGVATIRLNRPDRGNAWNPGMARDFARCVTEANASPAVRAVVITGAGRSFCVGADTQRLSDVADGAPPSPWTRPAVLALRDLDKPAIAAINGGCANVGVLISLLCDIRFAAAGAKLTTIYSRRGLPAEYGSSWLLPRVVGLGNASDLLLSGRTVRAEEALDMGLVNRVYPRDDLLAETRAYALDIVENCAPLAMLMIKRQLQADLADSFESSVRHSAVLIDHANKTNDFREGVASYTEKRPPRFDDLDLEGRAGPPR